jgi:hypothetical protein
VENRAFMVASCAEGEGLKRRAKSHTGGARPALPSARPIQYVPHLHMPPSPTVGSGDLAGVELPGDGVQASMTGRLDVPNDRQDIGRNLSTCALRATRMRSTAPAGSGVPAAFRAL